MSVFGVSPMHLLLTAQRQWTTLLSRYWRVVVVAG